MRGLRNIYNLGVKELRSLLGDKAMLALIVFAFTISVYSSATVLPGSLHLAPIAIADMDQSQLSNRIVNSFYRPWFLPPEMITATEMDAGLDAGRYTIARRTSAASRPMHSSSANMTPGRIHMNPELVRNPRRMPRAMRTMEPPIITHPIHGYERAVIL